MLKPIILAIVLSIAAAGCDTADGDAPDSNAAPAPKVSDVAKDYTHLTKITPKPVQVDPALAALCRGASQADVERARKTKGPHAYTEVIIYMNELAADAFGRSPPAYPVGSIIVKEKTGQAYWADDDDRKRKDTPSGVGGMIKRPPGYDPKNGDWEYFYFEAAAKIESGKIESCVRCHAGAEKKDHVFGNWAKQG